jgi:hypothetical protein
MELIRNSNPLSKNRHSNLLNKTVWFLAENVSKIYNTNYSFSSTYAPKKTSERFEGRRARLCCVKGTENMIV